MKIKTISRVATDCTRERSGDIFVEPKNTDPLLHPFQRPRELVRALNATKLERLFAKPFVGSLSGHVEGVYCIARAPDSLTSVLSGSADGDLRLWDLRKPKQPATWKNTTAHTAFIRGLTFVPESQGTRFISCSDDASIKIWSNTSAQPLTHLQGRNAYTGVDHHASHKLFATSSAASVVDIWNYERSDPVQTWRWPGSCDTVSSVKFNQVEQHIMAASASDRSIILYDLRMQGPLGKVVMAMRSNAISWNPMEAYYFASACEDHRGYVFDMRRLERSVNVLKGHVGAVMDIDFSPTGQELVTAGYDKTIRIFNVNAGQSRDVYHTSRMQRLFCAKFTGDSHYILSGSDDGNVRIWKTQAAAKPGILNEREKAARQYADQLKERYANVPEIKRISSHRRLPKWIKTAAKTEREERAALARKDANIRMNSKPGTVPEAKTVREEAIIAVKK